MRWPRPPYVDVGCHDLNSRYILLHLPGVPLTEIFIYQGRPLEIQHGLTQHIRERVATVRALLFPESKNFFVRMWRRMRGSQIRVSANKALMAVAGHLPAPTVLQNYRDSMRALIDGTPTVTAQDRVDLISLTASINDPLPVGSGLPSRVPSHADLGQLAAQRRLVEQELMNVIDRRQGIVRPAPGELLGHDDLNPPAI